MDRSTIWRYVRLGLLAFSAAMLLRALHHADDDWTRLRVSAVHQLWLIVPLLVVSMRIRTRPVIEVGSALLGGGITAVWLAAFFGDWAIDKMGANDPERISMVVPAIEEPAKLVPLLLVALVWHRRRGSPGIFDFGLLGMASGAGFALHEDALWGRVSGSGVDGSLGWLLPSMYTDSGVAAGHVVWTGLIGLALGACVTRGRRFLPLLAVAGGVAGVDHGTWNLVQTREDWRWLLFDGWLPVGLFLLGMAAAFLVDHRVLQKVPHPLRRATRDELMARDDRAAGSRIRRGLVASRVQRASALLANDRREAARLAENLASAAARVPTSAEVPA